MSGKIHVGPPDPMTFPKKSLGMIFYDCLQRRNPDDIAVVDNASGQEITAGKLLKQSATLATELKHLGITKDDVITILSANSWNYLVTILAGLYIGAKINLLNPDYTANELKHFFSICHPKVLFCTAKTKLNVLQLKSELFLSTTIILYDEEETDCKSYNEMFKNETDEFFNSYQGNLKEDVAFIVTSSGTTGLPKCVQLTHSSVRVTLHHCDHFDESDTTMSYLPFFHLFGLAVVLASLLRGCKTVILEKFIPERFLKVIQEHRVTQLLAVPPILLFLVKSPLVAKYDISSIVEVLCAAASLGKDLEEMVEKRLNVSCVRKVYGLTESGVATVTRCNEKKTGSVGKVAMDTLIKVCHIQTGKVLPPGEVGELRINGAGVMKGYLGGNMKKEDVFDDEGFFKSGDLGYYDEEGFFYIVDRLKELIKYKGFQVAPAELENLLSRHPSVQDVGVIGIPDERAGEVPLAFIVRQPNQNVTEEELVRYVAENISVQKRLYGGVKFVDAIPRVPSGKILRKELRKLYLSL